MAEEDPACTVTGTELSDRQAGLRYIARQPILDRRGRVFAYELLFRSGPEAVFRGDGDLATRIMLDNSVMFGVGELTNGLPAFVNCTMEALTDRLVDILPPDLAVLEVLETLEPTPELIAACTNLKALGFKIALDDFEWKQGLEPLIALADYIKIDFKQSDKAARRVLLHRLKDYSLSLLAEKIETQEEYNQARAEGFSLFQGYYFCRPSLLRKSGIPPNTHTQVEILRYLTENPVNLYKVSKLVERDPAIMYRLLRLVNSPFCAVRQQVRSVESALIVIGEQTFRRVASLAIMSVLNTGKSQEILRMAFLRARFCELAARLTWRDPAEYYLLGLLSLLPAMLLVPMEEAVFALPLHAKIRDALLGVPNGERNLLRWIEAYERGDWAECSAVSLQANLNQDQLLDCAAEAMVWADATLRSAG